MVVETLLPAAAIGGTAGLAYATKRKIFPGAPTPGEENFVLPIKLKSANAEDINSRRVKGVRIPAEHCLPSAHREVARARHSSTSPMTSAPTRTVRLSCMTTSATTRNFSRTAGRT